MPLRSCFLSTFVSFFFFCKATELPWVVACFQQIECGNSSYLELDIFLFDSYLSAVLASINPGVFRVSEFFPEMLIFSVIYPNLC